MKNLLVIFLTIISNFLFAQNPRINPSQNDKCNLSKENEIWWNEAISETDTGRKFALIKKKIISDTAYKNYKSVIKTVSSPAYTDNKGNLCGTKILFVLKYNKKKTLIIDLLEHPKYGGFFNEINSENTNILLIPATKGGTALYGQRGSSGVVYMTVKAKILKRKIEKLKE